MAPSYRQYYLDHFSLREELLKKVPLSQTIPGSYVPLKLAERELNVTTEVLRCYGKKTKFENGKNYLFLMGPEAPKT